MAGVRSRGVLLLGVALAAWVAALVAGIIVVAATGGGPGRVESARWSEEHVQGRGPRIAMIEIRGEIAGGRSEPGPFGSPGGFGADDYVDQLRQAREDDSVRAVLLRIDSPGGAVVASDRIYRAVRETNGVKPVVALLEDVAASGGLYVAVGASEIVTDPATITGSIGVIAMFPNLEGTADKLGIRPIVIKSGRLKDIGSPFRPLTAEERRILQTLIDESYSRFVSVVAQGRELPVARVRALADGRIYSGAQARRLGLVDTLGGFDQALAAAKRRAGVEGEVEVVRYTAPSIGFGSLFFRPFDIGRTIRAALRDVGGEVGVPPRHGLHFLWLG